MAVKCYMQNDKVFQKMFRKEEFMQQIIAATGPLIYHNLRDGKAQL